MDAARPGGGLMQAALWALAGGAVSLVLVALTLRSRTADPLPGLLLGAGVALLAAANSVALVDGSSPSYADVPGLLAYPALAGNRAVTMPATENLVQIVLNGGFPPATHGNPRPFGMPPFATTLGDGDVAAVLTFIRSAWGNRAAPVSEVAVSQQRSSRRE